MRRLLLLSALCLSAALTRADEPAAPTPAPAAPVAGPLAQEHFLALLAREFSGHFNLEGELALELLRPFATPAVLAHDWQVQITEFPALPSSSMLARCRVLADGKVAAEGVLVLRASHWRDTWIARQPLVNGAGFDAALLDVRRTDLFRERDALPAVVGDRTFIFTRNVQPGRTLTWRDVARRPLIKKGDVVEVSAAEGQLVIVMKALAMQNGAQGEAVTVRNLDSRKDFTAFVVDENRVQVRF